MVEAYSHEVSSCGLWPGGGPFEGPVYYSYSYPEPQGFKDAKSSLQERITRSAWVNLFCLMRMFGKASHQIDHYFAFFRGLYEAAAEAAKWERTMLERQSQS